MLGSGRSQIYTAYREVTADNVIEILRDTLTKFRTVASECQSLLDFDAGIQPLKRKEAKKSMTWIDNEVVDNVAHEISDFWTGFKWGNPITFVQRGDSETDNEKADGIAELNNGYAATGNGRDLQKLAHFVEICGIGYTFVEVNTDWEEGESYFTRDVLDPRWSYVVRSKAYADKRIVMGVMLREDEAKNIYYTVYTKNYRFEVRAEKDKNTRSVAPEGYKWGLFADVEKNPLGKIAVCEWYRSADRTGVFESQLSACDNINLLVSDIANGVDQNIEAIWWSNNVEFEKEEVTDSEGNVTYVPKKPKSGEWVSTSSLRDGGQPSIQPLVMDYHLAETNDSYLSQRALILQKCHVPERNSTSGGSSGVAMDSASGWADAENVASAQECITVGCQMDEIRVVLSAIKISPFIREDSPMLRLVAADIVPAIRRPKNFDIASKTNAIATLLAHGFSLPDVIGNIPLFQDATQVINRSSEGVSKYQETIFATGEEVESRSMQDLSDQTERSPILSNG